MSFLAQFSRPSGARLFSTTAPSNRELSHVVKRRVKQERPLKVNDPDTLLPREAPKYPPYPYGPATFYKQSNRGLYGGKVLQFGHKISEEFNQKSLRIFRPNVQATTLWSDALKRNIRVKLVTSVLRTITKEGGLDNYLLKDTPARIKELGPYGWCLRYDILQRIAEHERTAPKPEEGLSVGKARLIKDLFTLNSQGLSFKQFRSEHSGLSGDILIEKLRENGADVSKYSFTE